MRREMTDTLAAPATHLLEVRHSRFLAQAAPVENPAQAMDFVARAADALLLDTSEMQCNYFFRCLQYCYLSRQELRRLRL